MIEKLRGTYVAALPAGIIIDVNGVGYGVDTPLSALTRLPPIGEGVELWTHTHVREDQLKLFGFLHYSERRAFEILISLSGVGPKVALAILSTMTVDQIRRAILTEQPEILENVPGIGKRLAEKIFVEIKPKMKKLHAATLNDSDRSEKSIIEGAALDNEGGGESDVLWAALEDVRSALENLGFKDKAINQALEKLKTNSRDESNEAVDQDFQSLMKEALKFLGRGIEKTLEGTSTKESNKKTSTDLDSLF